MGNKAISSHTHSVWELATEYGIEFTVRGSREWARISSTRPPRHIASAGLYVAICRRVSKSAYSHELDCDGRLVAVGWNHFTPTEWVRPGGPLWSFLEFWERTQIRPEKVGSDYNCQPEAAFALWLAKAMVPDNMGALARHLVDTRDGKTRVLRRNVRDAHLIKRCLQRTSARGFRLSMKAAAALGKLCPEMQAAALRSLTFKSPPNSGFRIRDLDWEAAKNVQTQLIKGGVRARLLLASEAHTGEWQVPMRFFRLLSAQANTVPEQVQLLAPAYPNVCMDMAIEIFRGRSPVELSDGQLTRAEAHRWLTESPDEPALSWFVHAHDVPAVRAIELARWLVDVRRRGGWGQLTKTRVIHGPAGQHVEWQFLDRLDEIQVEDLVNGPRTSPEVAFQHAAERVGDSWNAKYANDWRVLAPLPKGWKLYPSMRHLNTPGSLIKEGREMGHCVGGYVDAVERGRSVILSLDVRGHRSTVELTPTGSVLQHQGYRNSAPHEFCERVLQRFLARNNIGGHNGNGAN